MAQSLSRSRKDKRKTRLRGAIVEPIWGILLYFRGLKKVYTKGNELASKQVLAATDNFKKLIKWETPKYAVTAIKSAVTKLKSTVFEQIFLFLNFGLFKSNYNKMNCVISRSKIYVVQQALQIRAI